MLLGPKLSIPNCTHRNNAVSGYVAMVGEGIQTRTRPSLIAGGEVGRLKGVLAGYFTTTALVSIGSLFQFTI
jgi:hypothetical protein